MRKQAIQTGIKRVSSKWGNQQQRPSWLQALIVDSKEAQAKDDAIPEHIEVNLVYQKEITLINQIMTIYGMLNRICVMQLQKLCRASSTIQMEYGAKFPHQQLSKCSIFIFEEAQAAEFSYYSVLGFCRNKNS